MARRPRFVRFYRFIKYDRPLAKINKIDGLPVEDHVRWSYCTWLYK